MVAIPFPLSHFPGLRPSEGAGRLYGCYAEPLGDGGRAQAVRHRSPGLKQWGATTRSGYRGSILIDGTLYSAFEGHLERHGEAGGASTSIGVLNGTRAGFFARNNAATPDQVFVDPDGNIAIFTTGTVTNSYPDSDLPAVNSVTSIDGYLVFTTGDGKAFATGLNTLDVDALSFGSAESKPDGLVRGIAWGGRLYLMGTQTIEIWTDQALMPFAFGRVDVVPRGLAGPYCVTGFEDNFSKGLYFVADDNTVCNLAGNVAQKISPPDLDGLIEAVADKDTIEMCSYISRGHAFIQVSSPDWTWVCDLNTQRWHERPSYLISRSRITGSVYAFGKWLSGDTLSGNLNEITQSTYKEVDNPLAAEVWSAPVQQFPSRIRVAQMWFDFAVGVGDATGSDPIQTDPTVEISWSDDGGQSFGKPRLVKLGVQSRGFQRVRLNQCGTSGAQGRIVKVRVADPVHFGLMGGEMMAEPRAA